ncbi:McrC family protein [Methanococcus maripaludis]|uniref:5-methylcytosine-specific restriction enzyme subunit McrC n=1 Tax=Methanococcus maripaludis (strain DSM 14266 / JCM 13030 / NBRC 101832 / S2 / LL) TaxID=267377 RepID=Q6LZ73_METMP|nr:McrC family protein [Methanococcus maripaludis]CAF30312.1 conserved hypothetical protein [Methanococcus maripaludis S2]
MNNLKDITLNEFQYLIKGLNDEPHDRGFVINKHIFEKLELFVLKSKENSGCEFLRLTSLNGRKALQALNYVGIIKLKNGPTIEILPKINNDHISNEKVRRIFLKMLKSLKNAPFKEFGDASLKTHKMKLNEIFIKIFLDDLDVLVKNGLKSDYISIEDNLNVLKGKIKFNEHISKNYIHKERFYVNYDEFIRNRPENRIIKSTIKYLLKNSSLNSNLKRINEFLFIMDAIPESKNLEKDFAACVNNRLMTDYKKIIPWCKVFLKNESFTNFKGDEIAYALLYPMEKIFESYLTEEFKKSGKFETIVSQGNGYFLAKHKNEGIFRLKPDIYAETSSKKYIMDAKWKILNSDKNKNYGISQNDMYQLLSYAVVYGCNELRLLYPKSKDFKRILEFEYNNSINYKEKISLKIIPIDLERNIADQIGFLL